MTQKATILGWATLGLSRTITLSEDESIADLTHEEKISHIKDELQKKGFTENQIAQMDLEIDYIEE